MFFLRIDTIWDVFMESFIYIMKEKSHFLFILYEFHLVKTMFKFMS